MNKCVLLFLALIALSLLAPSKIWALNSSPCANASWTSDLTDIPALTVAWQRAAYKLQELSDPQGCPKPWICGSIDFKTSVFPRLQVVPRLRTVSAKIRAGYFPENPNIKFKGNILYFEGLSDSMLNHGPLFGKLSKAGYRVIAFDYMGQGGSTGNMENTRIEDIPKIGKLAWDRYARDPKDYPTRTILGWSTGGLAAYYAAYSHQADQLVLIAPGIAVNAFVGRQKLFPPSLDQITLSTLTTQRYGHGVPNPHVDPIRPASPLAAPSFTIDLMEKSIISRHFWGIPDNVRGFVLLSGNNDTYVNSKKTRSALKKEAPHFTVSKFSGSLHEIDNEVPAISNPADQDILDFLAGKRVGQSP